MSTTNVTLHARRTAARTRSRAASHNWLQALLTLGLAGVFLPAFLALGLLIIFESAGLILPGVTVTGADLGSMTATAATDALNQQWNVHRTLALSDGTRTWTAMPIDYGLYMDPNATVRAALGAGRGSYLEELQQIFTRKPREIRPVIIYNPSLARARLEQIAAEVKVDPQEGSLVYENGNFSPIPGVPGKALDIEAALAQFSADPQLMLMQGQVTLSVVPVQPQQVDFTTLVEHHKSLVNKPLLFQAYDPISDETFNLTIPPEALVPWIRVDNPLSDNPQVSLDGSQLPGYLDQWRQDQLGTGRVLESIQGLDQLTDYWQQGKPLFAMVRHLPTSYVVQRSDTIYSISAKVGIPYWRIEKANPGVDVWALPVGQTIVIPSKNDMLPLPVVLGKRIVISISQQHMWIYENGQELNDYVISSGMASSPTMPGVFQVTEHDKNAYGARWDLWMPNWLSIYEAAPGFFNGIHGLPLLHNGVRLWANALGRPASYGCIILGLQEAEDVYNWAENGVVVEIKR